MKHHLCAWAAMVGLLVLLPACTHQSVAAGLQSQVQPFVQTRDQAVAVVHAAKTDLGPMDINVVNVKYAALQQQANGYVGLVVESISTGSLDPAKSSADALALTKAIDGFNGSVAPLLQQSTGSPPPQMLNAPLPLLDSWVPGFKDTLASSWGRYAGKLQGMSADERTALAEQFKASLAWPDFQDIAAGNAAPQKSPTP
ncbi:MAG TPA: hypothetical protein VEJ41_03305 [Candidatus Acidoferrales bacterium]|nr:hypothetical protein [Candidatus Acidoferrales bacterium]